MSTPHDVSSHQSTAPEPQSPPAASPIADPVPVGIAGFAMTTFVLSCINAGFFGGPAMTPVVLGLTIFYGGLVQLLAGMWAMRKGETFVATAFCAYGGGFWLSYFFLVYFIAPHLNPTYAGQAVGLYLLSWAIFTFFMTIASAKTNLAVFTVFVTLTATYVLLTLSNFSVAPASLLRIGGYVGITCGVVAWYVAFAHVTNATFGRDLIPVWSLA
ncbi:MAG: acetate uptake transporter [Sciscionella sp.]